MDLDFSLRGKELKSYKEALTKTFRLIRNKNLQRSKNELKNRVFRRSIYAIKDIKKGDTFSKKNIKTFRPDKGVSAVYYLDILNTRSPLDIKKNYPVPRKILKKID